MRLAVASRNAAHAAEVAAAVGGRALRASDVLDLGMPPDVEPAVGRLAGVELVDLTALGQHLADRAVPGQIPQVRAIVTGLIDAALRVSKRARTQTTISTEGISLARAGLDLVHAHLGGLAGRDAVVLGTGPTGRLAARLLREAGAGRLCVASRDAARAAEVAAAVHGRPLRTSDVPAALAGADILVTATGATGATVPVLPVARVAAARAQAGGRPLFMLDLGMPPDVDPAVRRLAGVTLIDLTALGQHLTGRAVPGQIPQVRAIVAAEAAAYIERQQQAAATPVIAAMHAQIRQLADAELMRLHGRLPGLSEQERAETAATVHRILRKVLHQPTVRAREFSTGPNGPIYLDALRQLFDLGA